MAEDQTESAAVSHEDTIRGYPPPSRTCRRRAFPPLPLMKFVRILPARDVSEIIRTMPGVNLTGNSTSGQRGNNRQIDIRGMGPENTPDY
ncbi:outer membrane receptor FepA [Citrobacter freundii]|nr:outer membrane receptor FepA [Citrobacter freundii]